MKWNFIPLGALLSGSMTSFISSCNSSSLRLQGKKKRGKKEQDVNIQLHFWSHLFNTGNKFYVGFSHLKKQLKKKPHIRWELLAFQIILSHQTTHSAQFATVEFTVLEFTWIPTELYYVMWLTDRMFWARHSWTPLSSLMSDISHSSFYEVTFVLVYIQQLNLTPILLKLISTVQTLSSLRHTIYHPLEQNSDLWAFTKCKTKIK